MIAVLTVTYRIDGGDSSNSAGDSQGGESGIGSGSFDDGGQDASGYGGFGF
jgi:hypothetical protein